MYPHILKIESDSLSPIFDMEGAFTKMVERERSHKRGNSNADPDIVYWQNQRQLYK
jgi:hypothetical protein